MRMKMTDAFDLQLFNGAAAGGAAAAPAGEAAAPQASGVEMPKAETNRRPGSSRRGRSGDFDNVVFGKQEDAPADETAAPAAGEQGQGKANKSGVTTTSDTLEARKQAYRDFIGSEEYKDLHTEELQRVINTRFKETKGMEKTIADQKPVMDLLMQRYKVDDVSKLMSALEQDNRYYEEAAEEAGLTVEQYKAMQKLERENAELKQMRQRQLGEQQAQQQLAKWYQEGEKVKQLYPSFDLRAEAANRDFMGLLKAGLSVQQAYETVHLDEIKAAAERAAAQNAGMQVVAKLQQKSARPLENGTSSQSAVTIRNDVSKLTRAERAEVARRAARGDKITF